jgi:DnaA family protein
VTASHRQIPLGLRLNEEATFDNYYVMPSNSQLVAVLQDLAGKQGENCFVYLYGEQGTGRSHLLQAVCHDAQEQGQSAIYLSLDELAGLPPADVLENLETCDVICIDRLDAICGNPDWEEQLFHLYNRVREAGVRLLVATDMAPRILPVQLADLQSRLSWGEIYQLDSLGDDDKLKMLQIRAQRRGIEMPDEVAQYILQRSSRKTGELVNLLERLDRESLSAKRRLTIPFVREFCGW